MDLTKVHQANLAILKEIDRICREEGIQYMLDSEEPAWGCPSQRIYSMG